ncbi:MAG: NAD(+) diphosphatase [Hyphomicrobiaceae bacterium]
MPPTLRRTETLDRLSHLRANTEEIEKLYRSTESRFLIVIAGRPVISSNEPQTQARLKWKTYDDVGPLITDGAQWALLGQDSKTGHTYFTLFLSDTDLETAVNDTNTSPRDSLFHPAVDLRSLATQGIISPEEQSLAGQATALANWHANTRCCGRCGGTTKSDQAGWRRSCWACGAVMFPRMDPAVIMLVTDGTRAVLAHEPRFPDGMYSTLAGFVEPGDDVEHAVKRETFEEIGLVIKNVELLSTQPWPFPHSLMLGCIAHADPGELRPDQEEIEDARWFTRDELRHMQNATHPDGLWIPGPQSIANALIMHFLNELD